MKSQKHIFIFNRPWGEQENIFIQRQIMQYKIGLSSLCRIDPAFSTIVEDLHETDLGHIVQHVIDFHLRAVHQGENDWLIDWDRKDKTWESELEYNAYIESIEDHCRSFNVIDKLTDLQQDTLNDLTEDLADVYSTLYTTVAVSMYRKGILQELGDSYPNCVTFYELNNDFAFEVIR